MNSEISQFKREENILEINDNGNLSDNLQKC